jgi:hypothetical protein
MIKQSKVISIVLDKLWNNPNNNTTVYYYFIKLENGDFGSCGRMVENPLDMQVGCTINYEMDGTKIKYIKPQQQVSSTQSSERKKTAYKKAPDDFLGYAYAYAKDLVVAGKTKPKDITDLKEIAEIIYSHVTTLLTEGAKVNPTQESQEKKVATKAAIEK